MVWCGMAWSGTICLSHLGSWAIRIFWEGKTEDVKWLQSRYDKFPLQTMSILRYISLVRLVARIRLAS